MFETKHWAWVFGLGTLTTAGLLAGGVALSGKQAAKSAPVGNAVASVSPGSTPNFEASTSAHLAVEVEPAAAPVWPRRYHLRGTDLSGEAQVHEDGRVELSGRTFGGKKNADGTPFSLSGERTSTGRLQFTEHLEPKKGLSTLLGGFFGQSPPTPREFSADPVANGLSGDLFDREVSWTPAPQTDDLVALVVPGLSTNIWNQYGVPYLDENLAVFAARGIEARRVQINTEVGVAANAAVIAESMRAVVAEGKRVLLFAHSKGGADTVTALSDPANSDLLPHVAGFVAIQPVFSGARISDGIESGALIGYVTKIRQERVAKFNGAAVRKATDAAFKHLLPVVNLDDKEGSPLAWRDLRSGDRQAALAANPFPVDQVPTVTLRSSFSGRTLFRMQLPNGKKKFRLGKDSLRTPLVVFQRFVSSHYGEANDGMVSLSAQAIPGALEDVVYENLDHFEPGVRGESPITPSRLTQDALDRILPLLKPAVSR